MYYDRVLYPDTYKPNLESMLKTALRNGVDRFRSDRDLSYIGIAAWYLLSILDANVDASMFDYNIDQNLNVTLRPMPINTGSYTVAGINLGLEINF